MDEIKSNGDSATGQGKKRQEEVEPITYANALAAYSEGGCGPLVVVSPNPK